jgi:hypothetical protein
MCGLAWPRRVKNLPTPPPIASATGTITASHAGSRTEAINTT